MNNLNLKTKILTISLLSTLLVGITALISISFVMHNNNKVLYKSIADSMVYSSYEIESTLNNIKNLSGIIMADTSVQEQLTSLDGMTSSIQINDACNNLNKIILGYYNQYADSYIDSIHINLDNRTIKTGVNRLEPAPSSVMEPIIEKATALRGGALWVTDHTSGHGLILSRSIRRLEQLDLRPMGTISIFIDLNSLIKDITISRDDASGNYYFIFNDKELIYKPEMFTDMEAHNIHSKSTDLYQINSINGSQYFTVKSTLQINGSNIRYHWDYLCLVPYSGMYRSIIRVYIIWAVFIVLAIICAILLSGVLIKNITKHFDILADKMEAFRNDLVFNEVGYNYQTRGDEIGVIHRTFDNMTCEIRNLIQVNYVSELLKKEAQLKALENQINPHFLYNTLESVNWRAKAIGEHEISSMAEALGTMLRITLNKKEGHFTLRRELDLVQSYMTIQQIRFDDRLSYEVSIPDPLKGSRIPRLTIQPLVENAIHYALEEMLDHCFIQVMAVCENHMIHIYVKNNGSLFEDDLLQKLEDHQIQAHGFGIGLLNINQRLKLTFGDACGLTLYNEDNLAVARVTIPFNESENE